MDFFVLKYNIDVKWKINPKTSVVKCKWNDHLSEKTKII